MKKVLLVISSLDNNAELQDILNTFDTNGYSIHFFREETGELEPTSLPNILKYIAQFDNDTIDRIVLLSNIKEYLFFWYRCYNHIVDDFVYFISEPPNLSPEMDWDYCHLFKELHKFNGIEQETIQSRIYLNISLHNYTHISTFLLLLDRYKYFDDLSFFNFNHKSYKKPVNKLYSYNKLQYCFDPELSSINEIHEHILIENKDNLLFKFNCKVPDLLLRHDNLYFLFYYVITIWEIPTLTHPDKLRFIAYFFNTLIRMGNKQKELFYNQFINYIELTRVNFFDKVTFLSFLTDLKLQNDLLKKLFHILLHDYNYLKYHYPLLISSLGYQHTNGLAIYDNIYNDREMVLANIVNYYEGYLELKPIIKKIHKRIAIITFQLFNDIHSTSMLLINYAINLKKYYPDYTIKIFIDDSFVYSNSELIVPIFHYSSESILFKDFHEECFIGSGITLHYSDSKKSRIERIQEDLSSIIEFDPELIWAIGADLSITREILYKYYPVLDMSLGELPSSNSADIYISGLEEGIILHDYKKHNIQSNRKYYQHKSGVEFPKPKTNIIRTDHHLNSNDFVMVTVGNRLNAEMNESFLDTICCFIRDNSNVKWLIIGLAEHSYLKKVYSDLIDKKIRFINFENDLASLYKICDIYINPFRRHGGFSAGIAMNQSLPIVTLRSSFDVVGYVGHENSVENIGEYKKELQHLYDSRSYREYKGDLMKKLINNNFGMKVAIDEIVNFFAITIEEFNNRSSKEELCFPTIKSS